MHLAENLMQTAVMAVALGILAQVIAHRFRLPAILPLLIFGMAAGPAGLGLFDPALFGHGLEAIVHLGVAIILFEGGLSLDIGQLRRVGTSLRNLLTIGTAVTGVGAAALAHYLTGISWPTASLFGAIVTVTGPTVIAPLLRHMVAPAKARTLLSSEGLMIDPIGAVLAYFVLQWIERSGLGLTALASELAVLTATGTILGYVAGRLAIVAIRHRFLHGELSNLVTLALLLMTFLVAEHQASQSGILASVVMGLTLSAARLPDLGPLKAFKGHLTVLVISVLFILLSGQLDLGPVRDLGIGGALVMVGLIFLVRPLAVLLSIPPSRLPWRQRVLLGLTAPRGIVAAAVASLSAIALRDSGQGAEAATLEGLVYLTILATCTWSTVMAPLLPKWLGFADDPSRRRVVFVGAHPMSKALAGAVRRHDWNAVVIDSSSDKLAKLRKEVELQTVPGDARDVAIYERAGVERDTKLLVMTPNDELNLLIAELVKEEFHIEHPVVAVKNPPDDFGTARMSWIDLLGGHPFDLASVNRQLENGKLSVHEIDLDVGAEDAITALLRDREVKILVVGGWEKDAPVFGGMGTSLERFDSLTVIGPPDLAELLDELRPSDGLPEPPLISRQPAV